MSSPKSYELLQRYQDGQSEAATAIFDRYVERLIALARSRMGSKLKRRVDPEDVVQSAYRSFFVHAKNEEYRLGRSGDLWRLLASITLNKLYGQVEKQTAAKRNMGREEAVEESLAVVVAPDPTAAEIVAIVEQLHLVVDAITSDEQAVLTARLQGQSIDDIGNLIGKSARTVRRLLLQIQQQLEQQLSASGAISSNKSKQATEPSAPLQYSDYILEQLLGTGGMGKVYQAKEKKTGKTVAVKALHKSRQSDHRAVDQFAHEAHVLTKLLHPSIVGVQGLGQFPGGGYFMVMDFVNGIDLQSRLQAGPLPSSEAISIVREVAGAVQHAHDHGIVHCDLKPGNVLLDSNGHVFVTDFGFAFIIAGVPPGSSSSIGGTAGYIAPEVLIHGNRPTIAADIYALGMLLWVLATGREPSCLTSVESSSKHTQSIETICRRCLAGKPSDRFSSMNELIAEFDELIVR